MLYTRLGRGSLSLVSNLTRHVTLKIQFKKFTKKRKITYMVSRDDAHCADHRAEFESWVARPKFLDFDLILNFSMILMLMILIELWEGFNTLRIVRFRNI